MPQRTVYMVSWIFSAQKHPTTLSEDNSMEKASDWVYFYTSINIPTSKPLLSFVPCFVPILLFPHLRAKYHFCPHMLSLSHEASAFFKFKPVSICITLFYTYYSNVIYLTLLHCTNVCVLITLHVLRGQVALFDPFIRTADSLHGICVHMMSS